MSTPAIARGRGGGKERTGFPPQAGKAPRLRLSRAHFPKMDIYIPSRDSRVDRVDDKLQLAKRKKLMNSFRNMIECEVHPLPTSDHDLPNTKKKTNESKLSM